MHCALAHRRKGSPNLIFPELAVSNAKLNPWDCRLKFKKPLSASETSDNRLDTLGGPSPALEVLAWLLGSDERTFTHFDRHAAHIWAKTSRLEAETRHP